MSEHTLVIDLFVTIISYLPADKKTKLHRLAPYVSNDRVLRDSVQIISLDCVQQKCMRLSAVCTRNLKREGRLAQEKNIYHSWTIFVFRGDGVSEEGEDGL